MKMKKIIYLAISLIITFSTISAYASENTLSDIGTHWGKDNINYLVGKRGISGYTDGTFKPDNTITKAEFLKVALVSARNGEVSPAVGNHWAEGVFYDAEELGIITRQ